MTSVRPYPEFRAVPCGNVGLQLVLCRSLVTRHCVVLRDNLLKTTYLYWMDVLQYLPQAQLVARYRNTDLSRRFELASDPRHKSLIDPGCKVVATQHTYLNQQ